MHKTSHWCPAPDPGEGLRDCSPHGYRCRQTTPGWGIRGADGGTHTEAGRRGKTERGGDRDKTQRDTKGQEEGVTRAKERTQGQERGAGEMRGAWPSGGTHQGPLRECSPWDTRGNIYYRGRPQEPIGDQVTGPCPPPPGLEQQQQPGQGRGEGTMGECGGDRETEQGWGGAAGAGQLWEGHLGWGTPGSLTPTPCGAWTVTLRGTRLRAAVPTCCPWCPRPRVQGVL